MLEVAIIVCLAISFFLVLRHFPETAEGAVAGEILNNERKVGFMSKFFERFKKAPKQENVAGIEDAIAEGQKEVVNPSQINQAKMEYKETDPEVAKLLYESENAFLQNDLREAEDLAIEAIGKDKKCAQAYVIIGRVAFSRGSFADAKESYDTALKCDKENAEAYFGLGMVKLRDGNLSDGVEYLQKAVTIDRGNAEWYFELGKAFMEVRQFAKAAKALKRAASLDMENKEYKELASEAEDKQRTHSGIYRKAR